MAEFHPTIPHIQSAIAIAAAICIASSRSQIAWAGRKIVLGFDFDRSFRSLKLKSNFIEKLKELTVPLELAVKVEVSCGILASTSNTTQAIKITFIFELYIF